ncbi:MAG: HdeD family acid-resistance protein [Pirellulales bacterium]|nr:HdeD family acid-resistance protein [Pirellulales bacterium]
MDAVSSHQPGPVTPELEALRKSWLWLFAMGVAMVVLGTVGISWACLATITVAATWLFGFLLLAGGITEIVHSFWAGRWGGMLLHLLVGVLYTVVGFMIIDQPEQSAIDLTLVIALFLIVGGIFRIIFALSERFAGWGWVLLNGAVSLLLGMMIYKQWPASGLWVIGLFIGIELIFNGWAWIMLSLGLRSALSSK